MKQSTQASNHLVELLRDRMVALVLLNGQHITVRQLAILFACVDAEEPQTVGSLANSLVLARSVVSQGVTRMAAASLLRRRPDPNDHRSILIVPSPAGRRFYDWFLGGKDANGTMRRKA